MQVFSFRTPLDDFFNAYYKDNIDAKDFIRFSAKNKEQFWRM